MLRKLKDFLVGLLLSSELDYINVEKVREAEAYKKWHGLFTKLGQYVPGYQNRYEIMITVSNALIGRSISLDTYLEDMLMKGFFEDGGMLVIGGNEEDRAEARRSLTLISSNLTASQKS